MWLGSGPPRKALRGHRAIVFPGSWQGPYQSPINLNRDRPLQQCYRQHESLMSSETQQNSLYATKRAMLDSHPMSYLQERPGFAW